ncbi:MAG: hypothetical protein ABJC13_01415 [Acidobacteriota bacterium]
MAGTSGAVESLRPAIGSVSLRGWPQDTLAHEEPNLGEIWRYSFSMDAPDYLMCLECGSPCYVFEWEGERLVEAVCAACGNEDLPLFVTPEEFEEQMTGG